MGKEWKKWDGVGSGFWCAVKRWFYTRFGGHVVLREFRRSNPNDYADLERQPYDYEMTVRLVPKSELSPLAVHCSGEKGVYSIDHIHFIPKDVGPQSEFKAHHSWLYLGWNGWLEALVKKWNEFSHIDMKKVLLLGGIVIAICVAFLLIRH